MEAIDYLAEEGIKVDSLRIRAFPFNKDVEAFIESHDTVFVIEQNRDAQMKTLLVNECEVSPKDLISILNYDGMPITARKIRERINAVVRGDNVTPLHKKAGSKE